MTKRGAALFFLPLAWAFAAEDAPGWLREAAALKLPQYDAKTPAVVLLSEERIVVEENGRVTTTTRKALKVLTREGRRDAFARLIYLTGTGKVKDLRAWVITAAGDGRRLPKERVLDVALDEQSVYDEARARVVDADRDVDSGSVFGYEGVQEEKSAFTQYDWAFQDRLPTLLSRFVLTAPEGWRAESVTFNHAPVAAGTQGGTYSWELRDLPPLEKEPGSPHLAAIAPRVAVSFFPAAGAKPGLGRSMASWGEVSQWLSELSDPQASVTPEVAEKSKELTANAHSELEKVRAISQAVQSVKYVSIQTGIGRGGGYRPHTAADVFQKQYGDCKDKANLMRTMLASLGVKAYMLSVYSGDRTYVRQEWPSPQQFNHAIVAVSVSAAVDSPAVVTHPQFGRLLIFDPTDEFTPLGDLPWHEQGSWALIVAGAQGGLIRLPTLPAASNRVERESELTLSPQGSLEANVRETAYGQEAVELRRLSKRTTKSDFTKWLEGWMASGAPNSSLKKMESEDLAREGKFTLQLGLTSERYAQMPQNRLLIFRPAVLRRREGLWLTSAKRTQPVELEAELFEETAHIALPAGFKVDEMPDAQQLKTPYGTFAASWKMEGNKLVFKRRLEVPAATVAPGQYEALRDFFDHVNGAEQAPVVLVRE